MFGTIRKHQTWLWAVIITLTIISFVIFFSPYSRYNQGRRYGDAYFGSVNGERITDTEFRNAQDEVRLEYFFMSGGNWLNNEAEAKRMGFDVEQRIYGRLLLIQKQKQMGIHVGADVAAQYANEMLRSFEQRSGLPNAEAFVKQVLEPRGLKMDDFDRFVRHQMGIQELMETVAISGKLVTPQEAQSLYIRERQEASTEAVFFSASNYLSQVSVTPEALSQFYSNQIPNYRIPQRVQLAYVKFDVSNYLAQAEQKMTNLNQLVEANAARLGTNSYKGSKTPEEAKAKIREEMLKGQALGDARKDAFDFVRPLFDEGTNQANALENLAKTNGRTVRVTAPFDRENGPKDIDVGTDFTKYAFSLTPDQPIAEPIVGHDGVYVIELNKTLPSEVPSMESIHDKVVADYKLMQAASLARRAGAEFARAVTNGIAQGKTFAAVAADAKQKVVELPPFSLSTQELPAVEDQINLRQLKEISFTTGPGKVSEFQPTREGGIVLHVKTLLPVDDAKMKADLPAFIAYVRQSRQREAFEAWFRREADRGLRDTPVFAPKQQPAMSGTAKS